MYVYSYYNKKVGAFEDPFVQPVSKEMFPKLVSRSVVLNPDEARRSHRFECDLYYLGEFNEDVGSFELLSKPEFLIALSPLEVKTDESAIAA